MNYKDGLVMMSRDWLFTIARLSGESDVAILRFLSGSSRSCRLRTAPFWP
jgi:hypothetical protein